MRRISTWCKKQWLALMEEHEQMHTHRAHVRKIKRMIFWSVVAGLVFFTGHELRYKVLEVITGVLLEMIVGWE